MSIYSEYEHGYITEAEFRSAAYREYAGENDHDCDDDEGDAFDDMVSNAMSKVYDALEAACEGCEWGEDDWCPKCMIGKIYGLIDEC